MQIQLTVCVENAAAGQDRASGDRQVLVECDPGTSANALTAALGAALDLGPHEGRRLVVDGSVVPSHTTVGMPPLLTGAVVVVRHGRGDDSRPRDSGTPTRRWELRVESGPDVGRRLALPPVASVLGRDRRLGLCVSDPRVSRRHAELTPSPGGALVRDLGGANGTSVNGRPVGSSPVVVAPGGRLRVGSTSLSVHPLVREARHLPGDGEGHLLVDPVTAPPTPTPTAITLPGPPPDGERSHFPWLALVVPLVLAAVLAAVMRSPTMLLFGLSGPALSFGTWVTTRRGSRRRTREEVTRSLAAHRATQAEIDLARSAERQDLMKAHPTLATLLTGVETRSRDLWAQPAGGSAAGPLDVRLGIGSPPSRLPVTGETVPSLLADTPVTVDLADIDLVAVLGDRTSVLRAAINLVSRLAAQHAPRRVEVYVLVGSADQAADWSFARLLPHVLAVSLAPVASATAPTSPSVDGVAGREVPWLGTLVGSTSPPGGRDRGPFASSSGRSGGERDPPGPSPRRVVVVDGGPALLRAAVARTLLGLASDQRITLVALGDVPVSGVPTARSAVVSLVGSTAGTLVVGSEHPVQFVPDLPGTAYAWALARALAPLRELHGRSTPGGIPDRVRLLDLVTPDVASPASAGLELGRQLVAAWTKAPRSTRAVLGVTHQGRFTLDLQADGPHALVGGTTGAGKSELLQTLVTSLALANRPDEMTFVLVDYKGGAAFRGCAELPHVVGWVTDLDAHLTRRALLSLGAEVRRRERILASAGVPDLDAYQRRRDQDPDRDPLPAVPRLVIVIDEFRVLAEELPDFVPGLVRLAAVGRSLGIHLVLATQRPGGIVTADIRANVSLRIALRVRDRSDSMDIIERPDAATVSAETPGRAYLVGAATALSELQTAQVTGTAPADGRLVVADVTRWWEHPGLAAPPGPRRALGDDPAGEPRVDPAPHRRDLDDIVTATRRAAQTLGARRPPAPWLPPLPETLALTDLVAHDGSIPLGLVDLPDRQTQESWCWPMDGHLGIAGGPGSGRTTALRTIAGAVAASGPPTGVHLYAIGSPALGSLATLAHTAAVAGLHDAEHASLVVERLSSVVRERIAGHRDGKVPRVVVLVDGWEQLAGLAGGSVGTELRAVLEMGRTVGVTAVVTGGRAVLSGQLASLFSSRLVLRVADPVDLALAGIPLKAVPLHQPPGRAVVVGSHQEMQVALLGGSTDDGAQDAQLTSIARRWEGDPTGSERMALPRPVRRLPARIRVDEIDTAPDGVVLGITDGDLRPVHLTLARGHRRFVVIGPAGSGRTTTLTTLALGLVRAGHPVAVVGPDLTTRLAALTVPVGLMSSGTATDDVDRLITARRAHPSLCVLVDDIECPPALDAVLQEIARLVDADEGLLAVATTPAVVEGRRSALVGDLERGGTGLLLWPRPGSHHLGIVVPMRSPAQPDPPGRGILVHHRTQQCMQVAET